MTTGLEGAAVAKEFFAALRAPLDLGLAGLSLLAGAGADAYWNILTPAYFDPTASGTAVMIGALSLRALWRHGKSLLGERRQLDVLVPYLQGEIGEIEDERVARAFAADLALAKHEPERLPALRDRLEDYLVKQASTAPAQIERSTTRHG